MSAHENTVSVRKVTGEVTRNTFEICKLVLSLSKCLIPQLLNKHRHQQLFDKF